MANMGICVVFQNDGELLSESNFLGQCIYNLTQKDVANYVQNQTKWQIRAIIFYMYVNKTDQSSENFPTVFEGKYLLFVQKTESNLSLLSCRFCVETDFWQSCFPQETDVESGPLFCLRERKSFLVACSLSYCQYRLIFMTKQLLLFPLYWVLQTF